MGRNRLPQCYSSCVPAITSRQNPIVARFRAAARGESADLLLLDGAHLVAEALGAGIRLREAATTNGRAEVAELADRLRQRNVPVTAAASSPLRREAAVHSSRRIFAGRSPCWSAAKGRDCLPRSWKPRTSA